MSVGSAVWKSDGHCRENLLLGKEERAGQRYYKGFASAHIETPPFIFGKVDVSRSAMHCQNGWRLAPHKESKAPPLQLSSYTCITMINGRRCNGADNDRQRRRLLPGGRVEVQPRVLIVLMLRQ